MDSLLYATYCSSEFVAAMGGGLQFTYGDGELSATCQPQPHDFWFHPEAVANGWPSTVLGTEDLRRFDAFG